jgi:hypothetical protein
MRAILGLVGGIGLGLTFSQFPEYAQQYQQRLGGAVDELSVMTERFDASAARSGLSRDQALLRYESAEDDFLAGQGGDMESNFHRIAYLRQQLADLENSTAANRLLNLGAYLDPEIASRTLDAYKPAVPATAEGVVYAGFGLLMGYAAISILAGLLASLFRRKHPVRPTV